MNDGARARTEIDLSYDPVIHWYWTAPTAPAAPGTVVDITAARMKRFAAEAAVSWMTMQRPSLVSIPPAPSFPFLPETPEDSTFVSFKFLPSQAELGAKFRRLADRWREQTSWSSSVEDQVLHMDYLTIIGMGEAVLPFILRELRDRGGQWFVALRAITEQDPTDPANRDTEQKKTAWLQWGATRGLI